MALESKNLNGGIALLSPANDLAALAGNFRQLGAEGRRRAVELFSEQVGVQKYLDCYSSLVADFESQPTLG